MKNYNHLPRDLRWQCKHDSFSVEGCVHCEAADAVAELQAEVERQRNEIKSLTERDTRLVRARDEARNEVEALQSWQESMRHAANEWADATINGLQWLRNIRDGISSPATAIADMESNITHCRVVQARAGQPAPPIEDWLPVLWAEIHEPRTTPRSTGDTK